MVPPGSDPLVIDFAKFGGAEVFSGSDPNESSGGAEVFSGSDPVFGFGVAVVPPGSDPSLIDLAKIWRCRGFFRQ